MNEYEDLKGEDSIFVRFRHGNKLFIKPNIRDELQKVAKALKDNPDHKLVFKEFIEDIKDGSGLGVHPNSTWYAAVKEAFNRFERDKALTQNVKDKLIAFLELVGSKTTIEKGWDSIKSFLIANADILSGWDDYQKERGSFFGEILRDEKGEYGEYYMLRGKQRIEVTGDVKTNSEKRFEFISDNCTGDYGRLRQLLGLVSLLDICDQYEAHPEHFSSKIICSLGDNDLDTYYLKWRWHLLAEYDYMPATWRPRSCFSDPVWLAYDVISHFAEEFPEHKEIKPHLVGSDLDKMKEAFKGYALQFEVALETDLYLGDSNEVYFDFLDRKVRWINGTQTISPMLVIPCKKGDFSDGIEIAKKFLSALVEEVQTPIVEITNVGSPTKLAPLLRQPRVSGGAGFDPEYLITEDVNKYTDKKWIGLAYYKDGINSNNNFYSFLSFYKLIQLAFDNDDKKTMRWINDNAQYITDRIDSKWLVEVMKPGQKPGNYLYGVGRTAAAHIEYKKGQFVNPDSPDDYMRVQQDLPIIRGLATKVLNDKLL